MTDKSNDGGPAFPNSAFIAESGYGPTADGMSLRDWFATHAPEVAEWYKKLWHGRERNKADQNSNYIMKGEFDCIASWNFEYADAMIKKGEEA